MSESAKTAMHYLSTRKHTPATTLSDAITAGIAPDGGLYVPQSMPQLTASAFPHTANLAQTAAALLQPFFAGDRLQTDLASICAQALDFPTPLRPLGFDNAHVLELFHGPTAAFKDIGARFLAACLSRLRNDTSEPLTILVATSGDTGAAVAAAFHRVPGIRVVILYPDGRVSPRQAHQLGCFGDNVQALRITGSFDDCQRMVKHALGDTELKSQVPMSSANSISLGRLLPQMAYYAHAALRWHGTHGTPLNTIVPTGNLGNALACLWVRAVGLPIGRIHLACNANDVLPRFLDGAAYQPHASVATLANAMDVGAPSNFERLRWLYPDDNDLRSAVTAGSVDDAAIRAVMTNSAREHDEIVCPHTACAMHELQRLRAAGDTAPWTIVATAHPAKFDRVVEPLIGREVAVPDALQDLLQRPADAQPMAADSNVLRTWLLDRARN